VAHRDSFEHCDLISNLVRAHQLPPWLLPPMRETDHMFSSRHKPFVDDLSSIVSSRVDVDTLFHHRV
jgi:hypothetical protein